MTPPSVEKQNSLLYALRTIDWKRIKEEIAGLSFITNLKLASVI